MDSIPAIDVRSLAHRYGPRVALDGISFSIQPGEIFALLGPNGGGKTTLFRLLSTLMPVQQGDAYVFGHSVRNQLFSVRRLLGVVFQSPSLDKKLTVDENIAAQAALYGLRGATLRTRRDDVLAQLGLTDRRRDLVETLSGGLRRRVDVAKSLIHRPRMLLLDEPSTGLDPGARSDLWRYLRGLREQYRTTIVLTSHLLDEADRADQVAILHAGQLVASGSPASLRASVGGTTITIETDDAEALCQQLNTQWQCNAIVVDGTVRLDGDQDATWAARIVQAYPRQVRSIKLGQPTLEDVFIRKTGHHFWHESHSDAS